jgi:uncharacterized repeat protein (TIGR01451 family)
LQECLDNATPGTTLVIQPGTYVTSLTLSKAVSLTGVSSATVILQALPNQRVLTVTGDSVGSYVVIQGLTLEGGQAASSGGGLSLENGAAPVLSSLVLRNNTSTNLGGGVYSAGPLSMTDVALISNTSAYGGGGAYSGDVVTLTSGLVANNQCTATVCSGGGLQAGTATVAGSLFSGNTSGTGGGLSTFKVALTDTTFTSNTAWSSGGGVHTWFATLSGGLFQGNSCMLSDCFGGGLTARRTLHFTGTWFVGNTAGWVGGGATVFSATTAYGGLFQDNASESAGGLHVGGSLLMTGTQFVNNTADLTGGLTQGAAVEAHISNALFARNTSKNGACAAAWLYSDRVAVVHTTVSSPTIGTGSAVCLYGPATITHITNTIIASYTLAIDNRGGPLNEDHNLYAGVAQQISGTVSPGGHSFVGNPAFYDPAGDDYHLGQGSTAIDAGTDAGVGIDFEGQARPNGAGVDIGYDEARLAELRLTMMDGLSLVHVGDVLTYTIIVTNSGPDPALGIVVSDQVPPGLIDVAWSCQPYGGGICPSSDFGSPNASVDLPLGASVILNLRGTVAAYAGSQLVNTVLLVLPSGLADKETADNTASDTNDVGHPVWLPITRRE